MLTEEIVNGLPRTNVGTVTENFSQFDTQTELYLISVILTQQSVSKNMKLAIAPAMFYSGVFRLLYEACLEISNSRVSVNLISLPQQLKKSGNFEKVGAALLNKISKTFVPCDESALLEIIRDKYFRRKMMEIGQQLYQHAQDETIECGTIIENLIKTTSLINKAYQDPLMADTEEMYIKDVYKVITDKTLDGGLNSHKVAIGYSNLDEMSGGGMDKDDLTIVAGRTSMGKSKFLSDVTHLHNKIHNKPVIYFTFESSIEQIGLGLLNRDIIKDADYHELPGKLGHGNLAPKDWQLLQELTLEAGRIKIASAYGNFASIPLIIDKTLEENNGELGLIVIDYLQLMEVGDNAETMVNLTPGKSNRSKSANSFSNRVAELTWITRQLKAIARFYNTPVIAAAQLNRNVEGRNDKRPVMSDIGECGAAERDADRIWMLYRDEYYNPETVDKGILEVGVQKSRNGGRTGTAKFLFDPQYSRLRALN